MYACLADFWFCLHDLLSKDSAPAWVQAVGSVLAICVAVAIPAWQHRSARCDTKREQFLQARSLIFGVSAELLEIEAAHQNAERVFAEAQNLGQGTGRAVREFIGRANIVVPPMLLNAMDRFYLLGEPAALTLPQLVTITLQYERKLAQIISGISCTERQYSLAGGDVGFAESLAPLVQHINVIRTLLQQADAELHGFDIVNARATITAAAGR